MARTGRRPSAMRRPWSPSGEVVGQEGKFSLSYRPDNPRHFIEFLELLHGLPDFKEVRARGLTEMRIRRGDRVLDVGCGIGTVIAEMADLVGPTGHICGMDSSQTRIAAASERTGRRDNVEFAVAQADVLPYPDRSFDAVRTDGFLLDLSVREKAVAEMARVTKAGGRIVFTDVDFTDVDFDCSAVTGHERALTGKMVSLLTEPSVRSASGPGVPALLRAAGLGDVTVDFLGISVPHEFCRYATQGSLRAAVKAGKVTSAEVEEWYRGFAKLEEAGDFVQIWFFVIVSGTVF